MKKCFSCGIEKQLAMFYRDASRSDGLRGKCKSCTDQTTQLKAWEKKESKAMNQQKFESIHRGLTIQAKKAYGAVPIGESWNLSKIKNELDRLGTPLSDQRTLAGCINHLISSGLVVESPSRFFKREVVRLDAEVKASEQQKEIEVIKPTTASIPPITKGPLDMLGEFAQHLRSLANDIESIAIVIASETEKNDLETAKLRQLQLLLKSLG